MSSWKEKGVWILTWCPGPYWRKEIRPWNEPEPSVLAELTFTHCTNCPHNTQCQQHGSNAYTAGRCVQGGPGLVTPSPSLISLCRRGGERGRAGVGMGLVWLHPWPQVQTKAVASSCESFEEYQRHFSFIILFYYSFKAPYCWPLSRSIFDGGRRSPNPGWEEAFLETVLLEGWWCQLEF